KNEPYGFSAISIIMPYLHRTRVEMANGVNPFAGQHQRFSMIHQTKRYKQVPIFVVEKPYIVCRFKGTPVHPGSYPCHPSPSDESIPQPCHYRNMRNAQ